MKSPIERLSEKLIGADSSKAAIVYTSKNRRYLTEFKSSEGTLIVTKDEAFLLVDFRYAEAAGYKAKGVTVKMFLNLAESVKEVLKSQNIKEVYLENESIPYGQAERFKAMIEEVGANALFTKDLDDVIKSLRIIKSPAEVKKIEAAQAITDAAFSYILTKIHEGITEREIALDLEFFMKKEGAEALAFETIAVAGKNGSQCHGVPGDNKVQKGDFITIDMGAMLDGYHSDMTRTVAVGEVSAEQKAIYDLVLKAHLEAAKAVKPGLICSAIDKIARDIIETPYPGTFEHGLGHGVGFEIHEWPRFNKIDNTILEAGMVITDEPGIYIAGKYGVRIEDMLLVTEDGAVSLTKSPKELITL